MTRSSSAGQCIFSLSLAQGIMTAYGSYAPETTDMHTDAFAIVTANFAVELLAGFAVFSTLGNMAVRQTGIAGHNPALRANICDALTAEELATTCAEGFTSCAMCSTADWRLGGACCGQFSTSTVAQIGRKLGFTVRARRSVG